MYAALKYCKEKKIKVIGLIYDGFLPTSPIDCTSLNNFITAEVGVFVRFTLKPWHTHEEIGWSTNIQLKGNKIPDDFLPTLETIKQKRLFFIPFIGNFYLPEKAKSEKIGNCFLNKQHAELLIQSWGISSISSFLGFGGPLIDQVIMNPAIEFGLSVSKLNEDQFTLNLWNGMKVTPNDDGFENIQPFLDHIKLVWSQNDEVRYTYNLQWLAHKLQKPHKRIGVAIVLRGGQGSGKSQICHMIMDIIGPHHSTTMNSFDEICGNFNPKMSGNIFITLEEAVWGGSKKEASRLKDVINGKDSTINDKYDKKRTEANFADFIINSNNEHVISMEKDDRRYFIQDTDNTYCVHGGVKTFEECRDYHAQVRDVPRQQICNYLHQLDISDFVPEKYPKTKACQDTVLQSDNFLDFIHYLENEPNDYVSNVDGVLKGECIAFYHLWQSLGFHLQLNQVHFGRRMNKHYGTAKNQSDLCSSRRLYKSTNTPTKYIIKYG